MHQTKTWSISGDLNKLEKHLEEKKRECIYTGLVWLQHAYTIESLLIPYLINAHLYSHANKEERMTILDELTNGKNITEVIFNYKECLLNNLA